MYTDVTEVMRKRLWNMRQELQFASIIEEDAEITRVFEEMFFGSMLQNPEEMKSMDNEEI